MSRIYLVGFMGSGKSTFGKKLASKMGYGFLDLDEKIEQETQMDISTWFSEQGEEAFRKKEAEILVNTAQIENTVIATGGGAACFHENMEWMNAMGTTVYLKLFENKLFNRIWKAQSERPLVSGMEQDEVKIFVHETLTERSRFYSKAKWIIQPELVQAKHLAEWLQD